MSVTFWVPDAPRERTMVPCTYGAGEPWECRPGERCGYCADGLEERWESPASELNVANATAYVLLEILGIRWDPWGTLPVARIATVRREIVRALSTARPERAAIPGVTSGGNGTARVISAGLDGERIRERLTRLDAVLAYAQAHQQKVSWG